MKVLQINSVFGIGSTGRICTDIADMLEANGHECRVAFGREDVPENYRRLSVRIGSEWSVKAHALRSRLCDDAGFGSRYPTKQFIDWIDSWQPDVIHLHNLHGYYINIEILFNYLKDAGKPVVWTLHDCWAFTGHCVYFDYAGCTRWKDGCHHCPQKKSYPSSLFLDHSCENYLRKKELFTSVRNLTLVSPSNWLRRLIRQSFISEYPVRIIHNGIDLEQFKPTPSDFRKNHGIGNKIMLLGVASEWNNRKGLGEFLELAGLLEERFVIVLVGLSERQMKFLPANVIGIHRTDSVQELAEIYTAADVFVNPTLEDNFPTVNLEAMACGTPVITYDTGGSPESLSVFCGVVIEKGEPSQVIEALNKILSVIEIDRYCIGQAALFDKKTRFDEYLHCYAQAIDKGTAQ